MLNKIGLLIVLVLLITSCKTKSAAIKPSIRSMSANKVIKNHYNHSFDKETMVARMKVKYKGKDNLPGVTASLRLKKDKTIWMSLSKLGFPVGKVLITRDKVSYYEKVNKTYFDGNFSLLSNWLGTELDYDKVQNLLLGQAIMNLSERKHLVEIKDTYYQLSPKNNYQLFDILYLIDPQNFKLISQQVDQTDAHKTLHVDYSEYQKIDDEFFPKKIVITATDSKNISTIDLEYRSVEFNKPVNFPFSIPDGYKEIKLK